MTRGVYSKNYGIFVLKICDSSFSKSRRGCVIDKYCPDGATKCIVGSQRCALGPCPSAVDMSIVWGKA